MKGWEDGQREGKKRRTGVGSGLPRGSEQKPTYDVGRQRVVLQVLVPLVQLFLHPAHQRLLEVEKHSRVTTSPLPPSGRHPDAGRCHTHRVVEGVDPRRPRSQAGTAELPLRWHTHHTIKTSHFLLEPKDWFIQTLFLLLHTPNNCLIIYILFPTRNVRYRLRYRYPISCVGLIKLRICMQQAVTTGGRRHQNIYSLVTDKMTRTEIAEE